MVSHFRKVFLIDYNILQQLNTIPNPNVRNVVEANNVVTCLRVSEFSYNYRLPTIPELNRQNNMYVSTHEVVLICNTVAFP